MVVSSAVGLDVVASSCLILVAAFDRPMLYCGYRDAELKAIRHMTLAKMHRVSIELA
jgi:hypothetical protein